MLDRAGSPLPTGTDGVFIGPDGSPLPTDSMGRFVHFTAPISGDTVRTLPTDDYGHQIHPVVDQFDVPLPTNAFGHHLDADGEAISTDEFGRPVDASGNIFPQNAFGQYVYTRPVATPEPSTVAGGKMVVVDAEGRELERNEQGGWILSDGGGERKVLATSADGLLLGPNGSPLPTNAEGQFVYAWSAEREVEKSEAAEQPIHVVGPDGSPFARDPQTGRFLDPEGKPIEEDARGRPLDRSGRPLSTNIHGSKSSII